MKIGTQLTAGAVAIGTMIGINTGIIFWHSEEAIAKRSYHTGIVEGNTQRSVKLEISNHPNQELITKIDNEIEGLINGSEELDLEKPDDAEYIAIMEGVREEWRKIKVLIQQVRSNPNDVNREALLAESEKLFEVTDAALLISETALENDIEQFKNFELSTSLIILIIVGAIIANTRRISSTLNKFTSNIAQSTNQIAAKVERQENVANEQASSVGQTTSTVDSLGDSSRRSAIQAEESAKSASTALSLAESGAETVEQTRVGMESLKERVREIAEQIINLSEQTEQIAGVSELVGDLASQTNMLALNAAVEAARAGEYGKGFGVVAGEIRKLADQSRKSADRINNLVTDVQAAMNSAVMVTDEGKKTAESSIELALNTAESFIGVKDAINNVFANTSEISNAAKQQAIGIQEILAAVNALNLGAMDTAADMEEVKTSTVQLKESADELKAIV